MKLFAFIVFELALGAPAFAQEPCPAGVLLHGAERPRGPDRHAQVGIRRRGESRSEFRRQSSPLARLVQQEARPELDGRVDRVSSRWLGRDAGAGEAELRKGRTIGLSD